MTKHTTAKVILKSLTFVLFVLSLGSCSVEFELTPDDFITPVVYIPKNILSEKEGLLGQAMQVTGENFILDSLSFYFNDKQTYATYTNKNDLSVKIPRELDEVTSLFKIFLGKKDSLIYSSSFKLKKPKISGYSRSKVTFSEEFSVYGENFDNDRSYISAFLNDQEMWGTNFNFDAFRIIVPNDTQQKKLFIKVNSQLQEDNKQDDLELQEPIIESFPSEVLIGANGHKLEGKYFNPETKYSKITINDNLETKIEYTFSNENIDVIVPYGPYSDFKIRSISYETAGMKVQKEVDIKIISNHILYSKTYPVSFISNQFVFNDEFYVISNETDFTVSPPIHYLWKFDFTTQEWERKEAISLPAFGIRISEIKNGVLYIYRDAKSDGLFKLNMNTLTLENITNIPDENNRANPIFFTHNKYLYLGKGSTFNGNNTNNSKRELYRADLSLPSLNWIKVNTDDKLLYQSKAFLNNGEMYISSVIQGSRLNFSLYKFNATNSTFKIVNDYANEPQYYIRMHNKDYRISLNRTTKMKRVFPFDEPFNEIFSFRIDSNIEGNDNDYFSYKNKVYFTGDVINDPYSSANGIYKLSDEINDQIK